MVAKEGVWPRLFCEFFMGVSAVEENESDGSNDSKEKSHQADDDMLFYVQNKPHSPSENEVFTLKNYEYNYKLQTSICYLLSSYLNIYTFYTVTK